MCINKSSQTHRTSGAGSPLTIQSSCTLLPSGTSLLLSFCMKCGGSHTGSSELSGGVRAGSSHAGSGSGSWGSSVSRLFSMGSSICWLSRIGLSRSSALMEYEVPSSWVFVLASAPVGFGSTRPYALGAVGFKQRWKLFYEISCFVEELLLGLGLQAVWSVSLRSFEIHRRFPSTSDVPDRIILDGSLDCLSFWNDLCFWSGFVGRKIIVAHWWMRVGSLLTFSRIAADGLCRPDPRSCPVPPVSGRQTGPGTVAPLSHQSRLLSPWASRTPGGEGRLCSWVHRVCDELGPRPGNSHAEAEIKTWADPCCSPACCWRQTDKDLDNTVSVRSTRSSSTSDLLFTLPLCYHLSQWKLLFTGTLYQKT